MNMESDTNPVSVLERFPEHTKAIGMLSIEISNLEMFLGQFLGSILHIDPYIAETIYLTPKTSMARIDTIENVAAHALIEKSDYQKKTASIITDARRLFQKRHELVHVIWGIDEFQKTEVVKRKIPIKKGSLSIPVPLEHLTDLINEVRKLCVAVRNQTAEFYISWPPYSSGPKDSLSEAPSNNLTTNFQANDLRG